MGVGADSCYQMYVDAGISVIPLYPRSKKPHFDRLIKTGYFEEDGAGRKKAIWAPATEAIAPESVLQVWFEGLGSERVGLALVAGAVSGNLVYADFDDAEAYRSWALAHKTVVNSTAVQKTRQGYHVFFRLPEGKVSGGALYYDGKRCGELRGTGMYVAAWPSIHPAGVAYKWLRTISNIVELPVLAEVDLSTGLSDKQAVSFHAPVEPVTLEIADREIIRIASAARNGETFSQLWRGDCSGYHSRSEAHLALVNMLAFWSGGDASRIDALFRQSGMYGDYEEKWDSVHRNDGATYGQMTIQKALADLTQVYRPRQVVVQGESVQLDWSAKYGKNWKQIK